MKIRLGLFASVVLVLASVLGTAPGASASSHRGLGVMIPSHPGRIIPRSNATEDSANWSGYAVTNPANRKITSVTSTFVVPAVNGTTPGFAATWTGIGGFNTSDLIQAGTAEEFIPGLGPNYYAWYEILPAAETQITGGCTGADTSCSVQPGDSITITIKTSGQIQTNQGWIITMTNAGHWSFTKTLNYASTYSSAEWILEAPTVGVQVIMPMMANSSFAPTNNYSVDSGTAQSIGSGSPVTITMNQIEGIPSTLDGTGQRFNACAYKLSCPAP